MLSALLALATLGLNVGASNIDAPSLLEREEAPQILKENDQIPFELSIDLNLSVNTNIQYTETSAWPGYPIPAYKTIAKASATEYNQACLIKTNEYVQTTQYEDGVLTNIGINTGLNNQQDDMVIHFPTTARNWENSIMIVNQITPYKYLYSVENTTTVNAKIAIDRLSNASYDIFVCQYTSIDNSWSQWVDSANWNTLNYQKDVQEQITDGRYGYNYNYEEQWIHNLEEDDNITEVEMPISIVGDKTNYVITFIHAYDQTQDNYVQEETYPPYSDWRNKHWAEATNQTYNGYLIPPVENYEYIDLPGLMFNILSLPFAFISTAFNVTIFPGTPYQLNISSLFLAIIGVMVFVFVIKTLVKTFGK